MEYYITIEGQEITVTEGVYRAYKQPTWAEHKRNDREKRCQVLFAKLFDGSFFNLIDAEYLILQGCRQIS